MPYNANPAWPADAPSQSADFCTTQWSSIDAAARTTHSTDASLALETLCRSYWFPLYCYIRRQGHSPEDAQDLTQGFFAQLLRRRSIRLADRSRGRFRTFLLTSLKNFLVNEWNKANRQKRGGGCGLISLDATDTETRFRADPAHHDTPEKAFDRQWALTLLDSVLDRLEREFVLAEKHALFLRIKPFLTEPDGSVPYAEVAASLGVSEGNLKVIIHRLRRRYRDLLREEIARTVENDGQIESEIHDLFAALSN